ncbi:TetR family transcriptional regulator [Actinopolyspora erythraea]|uniref:TetR family transcriptional regulator n=1 Tax=Actinopolyspora erythraea TaxID=414996 RepID=A0A099D2X9_9ACTN|nr:TetR family transcriptional regulator [Actinopolyspora erythraea]ASU77594.1 TetR family transcriptional regulator [Actinopolyspora erythraea]KGI80409.1 TetR family transcriptional regulator [Actinopolyspora erythraea]
MATGHTDPQRRERIIDAALDLIAEEGIANVSHRRVAARAGVPLGSMTYHFGGLEQLLREAFGRFAERIVALFDSYLAAPADQEQAREAVTDLVHELSEGNQRYLVLTQELYTLAARQPAYRELTEEWMRRSRVHLERHFDPDTARQLDALIEGLTLHRALTPEPHDRVLTREAVTRITTRDPGERRER